LKTEEKKEPFE